MDNNRHSFEGQTLQEKKIAPARKNSNAKAHCTLLHLPATAQANAKAKPKECNHLRFNNTFASNTTKFERVPIKEYYIN